MNTDYLDPLVLSRMHINAIDTKILELLVRRLGFVAEVRKHKVSKGKPIRDLQRENEHLQALKIQAEKLGLNLIFVEELFRSIMNESTMKQVHQASSYGPRVITGHCCSCGWNTSAIGRNGDIPCCSVCKTPLKVS